MNNWDNFSDSKTWENIYTYYEIVKFNFQIHFNKSGRKFNTLINPNAKCVPVPQKAAKHIVVIPKHREFYKGNQAKIN